MGQFGLRQSLAVVGPRTDVLKEPGSAEGSNPSGYRVWQNVHGLELGRWGAVFL